MNIYIRNIGIIESADIALDGITVLAGENDSGKSTVSKILYYILNDRWESEYEPNKGMGFIKLREDSNELFIMTQNGTNKETVQKGSFPFENTFYIESPFTIDDFNIYIKNNYEAPPNSNNIDLLNKLRTKNDAFISEDYEIKTQSVRNKLNEVLSGKFEIDKTGLKYVLAEKIIGANNLAAGLKTYSLLKILIENYWMSSSSLFIFDEPEIHLHPELQVALAELLVMLRKELDVYILVSTHSPYFLRAIQIFCKKYYIEDCANYYFSKKQNNFTSKITDVTKDLGLVYAALSKPFESLLEEGSIYDEQCC